MANTNNNFQLLIDLGVDNTNSRENINQYINSLKNLSKVKVELDVSGTTNSQKTIQELQAQIEKLNKIISNSSKNGFKVDTTDAKKEIKSLMQLTEDSVKKNGTLKINKDMVEGKEIITSIVQTFTNAKNEVQKIRFKPEIALDGSQVFKEVKSSLDNVGNIDYTNTFSKVEKQLKDVGLQGKIVNEEFVKLSNRLREATTAGDLNKLSKDIASLNKTSGIENQLKNSFKNANYEASQLIETLKSIPSLDKLGKTAQVNTLTTELKDLSKVKFSNLTEASEGATKIKHLSNQIKDLAKEASNLENKQLALQKFTKEVEKLHSKGLISKNEKLKFIDEASLKSSTKEIQEFQAKIQSLGQNATAFSKIKNATESTKEKLVSLNDRLTLTLNKLSGNVDTSKLDVINKKIKELSNLKIIDETHINKANTLIDSVSRRITSLGTDGNSMQKFNNVIAESNRLLEKMERDGYASSAEINKLKQSLSSINKGDIQGAKKALEDVKKAIDGIADDNKVDKGIRQVTNGVSRLQTELTKTVNLYRKSVDQTKVKELEALILRISKMPLLNPAQIEAAKNAVDTAKEAIKKLNAEATVATRNSMGVIDSFKTAMNKFPVWIKTVVQNKSS